MNEDKEYVVLYGTKENVYHELNIWEDATYCGIIPLYEEDCLSKHDIFFYDKRPKNHRLCKNCQRIKKINKFNFSIKR